MADPIFHNGNHDTYTLQMIEEELAYWDKVIKDNEGHRSNGYTRWAEDAILRLRKRLQERFDLGEIDEDELHEAEGAMRYAQRYGRP